MTTLNLTPERGFTAQDMSSNGMLGASPQDPGGAPTDQQDYINFSKNLMTMLSKAQKIQGETRPGLVQSKEQLQNQALNLSNPMNETPYKSLFGMMTPGQSVSAQNQTQGSFNPGISSINDQLTNADTLFKTFGENIRTAYDVNKPETVGPGQSLVTPKGTIVYQGHEYQPYTDQTTGLTQFYDVTGSNVKGGGSGGSIGKTTVGGIDFSGQATGAGVYASENVDPKDPNYAEKAGTIHAQKIGAIYSNLQQIMPSPTYQTIDQYIKAHARNAPVSGAMIMNAATHAGIDPLVLTAVLANESDFGTAGVATSTVNPGNVGNTGTSTKNFNSWQAGVTAAANELARRKVPEGYGQQTTPTQDTQASDTRGGKFSAEASTRVSKLPSYDQQYALAGPQGVAYIDSTQVPASLLESLKRQAPALGIPVFDAQDVKNMHAVQQVYEQIDNMKSAIDSTLNSGVLGRMEDFALAPINKFFQTGWGNDLKKIDSYRTTAISAVQALNGGAGSGLRINTGEIMANTDSFLPNSGDSVEGAKVGLTQLTNYLNTELAKTFPYLAQGQGQNQQTGRIKVKIGNQTGTIDVADFDPNSMTKI